jgi:hypothetical protein
LQRGEIRVITRVADAQDMEETRTRLASIGFGVRRVD